RHQALSRRTAPPRPELRALAFVGHHAHGRRGFLTGQSHCGPDQQRARDGDSQNVADHLVTRWKFSKLSVLVCDLMWQSCLLVFIASACTLVIELIAGRIMAPYVGVSLYTWTSIIGIVLAGMSVGNYLGGVVADRQASRRTLGVIFIAGSVASLLILVMTDFVIGQTFRLSLLLRIVVYTTAIFLLPSLVLGMVSPLVVKLALADLKRTGNTVGTIYAFSTAGSIVGTFLTGFWLISWLGTRSIVWIVAGVLLLTGLAVGQFHRSRGVGRMANGLVAPVFALAIFGFVW